jgi:hypothetical protein
LPMTGDGQHPAKACNQSWPVELASGLCENGADLSRELNPIVRYSPQAAHFPGDDAADNGAGDRRHH